MQNDLSEKDKIQNLNLKRSSAACIIYTSGTGGDPKGVILSHGGILNNLVGACEIMKPLIDKRPIFMTWLPLSHSYEHTVQFVQIAVGAKVFYAEKIEKLLDNISEAKPTIMTAVPRFYQNLYNKINMNMKKAKGFKAKLIKATIDLGKKELLKQKMNFSEKLMNSIVNFFINFFLTSRLILLYNTDELIPSFFDKVGTEIFASLVNSKINFKSNSSNFNNDRKMKHLVINVDLIMLILINAMKS